MRRPPARRWRWPSAKKFPVLTPEAIRWAYRLFLDREPENEAVVTHKLRASNTQELRRNFFSSEEFRRKNQHSFQLSGNEPPLEIDLEAGEEELARLFEKVRASWEYLGRTEPHWSVLTEDKFRAAHIGKSREEFFESGWDSVAYLQAFMRRHRIDPAAVHDCLELGCGLGRVTRWLAQEFPSVTGCDISASHLAEAKTHLAAAGLTNVELMHLTEPRQLGDLPAVDLIFSILVIQHNPPPLMQFLVRQLVRALRPGGVALLQLPTYLTGYAFSLAAYLQAPPGPLEMEMHVLPQSAVFEAVEIEGGRVLEVLTNAGVDPTFRGVSEMFFVQKRGRR